MATEHFLLACALGALVAACGGAPDAGAGSRAPGSDGASAEGDAPAAGAPAPEGGNGGDVVATPQDRCGDVAQTTTMDACHAVAAGETPPADAVVGGTDDPSEGSPYGDPIAGTEGADDACKYHVSWSTPGSLVHEKAATLTLVGSKLVDGTPVSAAAPRVEAVHEDGHVLALGSQTVKETEPGHYTIGNVLFDAAGQWTIRFHLFTGCTEDAPESPRAHVAFVGVVE